MPDFSLELEFRNKRWKDAQKGLEAFAKTLKGGIDGAAPVLGKELQLMLEGIAEAMAQRHGNPWPGGTSPTTLSVRSGEGIQSIRDSVKVIGSTLNDLQGEIGAKFPMSVHEEGATITPKKAKFLTIPLPAALNANGTPKKASARDWDNTFVARSKAGNLIIFRKEGTGIVPLYVLKTSVTIPPRLGLRKTINAAIPYFVERAMDEMVKAVMEEVA